MRGPLRRAVSSSPRAGRPGGAGRPGTGRPGRRAVSIGPAGMIWSSTLVAWPAVISFRTPPGTRSQITAWRRQATWFRARARSRWRLAQIFSTAPWPSAVTSRTALGRSAATATDRAPSGSFLSVSPASSSRTREASFGGTSSTRSPAATSCWARSRPSPAAPSTAQVRSGHSAAHATSSPACLSEASTRSFPSGCSATPIATAVCEPLCGSTPIITAVINTLPKVSKSR